MNQILYYKKNIYKKYFFFLFVFFISILLILIFLYYCFKNLNSNKKAIASSEYLADTVNLQVLYNYNNFENLNLPIIGKIEIKKLDISYPIFSTTSDELLKSGICKLYGPSINSKGNLCLAGHNYNNNLFFSRINNLLNGDIIKIYDTSNISIEYAVYDKFEVSNNDTSVLNQNLYIRELTLITCNNSNKNRIIVKAKEIE